MDNSREPTFGEVVRDLKAARVFILFGSVLGLALAAGTLALAVPHYRAQMLLGPTSETATADITALLGQFDLPNLQYIVRRPGPSESADFTRFEHILTGPSVAAILFEDARIRDKVAEDRRFRLLTPRAVDSPAALSEYLAKAVRVQPVGGSYLRRLTYSHPDPAFAAFLLEALRAATDELIRRDVRAQTEQRTAYLLEQLDIVAHPQHRQALSSILMEQEQVRMMINMDEPYAAAIAEPASASSRPVWPSKALFLPLFLLVGAFAGYAVHGARKAL